MYMAIFQIGTICCSLPFDESLSIQPALVKCKMISRSSILKLDVKNHELELLLSCAHLLHPHNFSFTFVFDLLVSACPFSASSSLNFSSQSVTYSLQFSSACLWLSLDEASARFSVWGSTSFLAVLATLSLSLSCWVSAGSHFFWHASHFLQLSTPPTVTWPWPLSNGSRTQL